MTRFSFTLLSFSLLSLTGCPDSSSVTDAGPQVDAQSVDTAQGPDANLPSDAGGPGSDGGIPGSDAGPVADAGPVDPDVGPPADAGPPPLPEPMNHRPDPIMCDDERDSPMVLVGPIGGCASHEECTEGDNGRCLASRGGNMCSYDRCFSDDDCTGPCICGTGAGANNCTGGACQVDSDCGPSSWCSPTLGSCGYLGGIVAYECHTPEDECTDDVDCAATGPNAYCKFSNETARWICDSAQCAG